LGQGLRAEREQGDRQDRPQRPHGAPGARPPERERRRFFDLVFFSNQSETRFPCKTDINVTDP